MVVDVITIRRALAVLALTGSLASCSFSLDCPSPREPDGAGCVCPEGWGEVADECVAPPAAGTESSTRARDAMSAPVAESSRLDAGLDLDADRPQEDRAACDEDGGCADGGLDTDAAAATS
jgi:hypothetical protein